MIGVSVHSLNRIERLKQEPRPSTIRKLAEVLGVEPQDLVGEPGDVRAD